MICGTFGRLCGRWDKDLVCLPSVRLACPPWSKVRRERRWTRVGELEGTRKGSCTYRELGSDTAIDTGRVYGGNIGHNRTARGHAINLRSRQPIGGKGRQSLFSISWSTPVLLGQYCPQSFDLAVNHLQRRTTNRPPLLHARLKVKHPIDILSKLVA